jgi:ABC-type branched-subunit amino acid transport system substrate-binding protein
MRKRSILSVLLLFIVPPAGAGALANALQPDAVAGKAIFVRGTGASGAIKAAIGAGSVVVPATGAVCASCHGRDGSGRPEGGIAPPDIRWPKLDAAADRPGPGGGARRAYDPPAIIRAVTQGVDVEGRPLDPVMPRYRLSLDDAADLVAYLKTLGTAPEPGVTAETLTLATILPPDGGPIEAVLRAYVDRLDTEGGLFGRQVRLIAAPGGAAPAETARQLGAAQPYFALVAASIAHDEAAMAAFAEAAGVPVIGAETLLPDAAGLSQRYLFFLDGGVAGEARVLARHAAGLGSAPAAVVAARDVLAQPAADAAVSVLERAGIPAPRRVLTPADSPAALVAEFSKAGLDRIIWLAPGIASFAAAADAAAYHPLLLAPAEFGADLLSAERALPIGVAFRTAPPDRSPEGLAFYRDLAEAYHLKGENQAGQIRALVAIRLLVEALQRAGRDVTREQLVDTLANIRDFRTGLIPPISYGPSRRIGTTGAWIVQPGAAPEWLDPARR